MPATTTLSWPSHPCHHDLVSINQSRNGVSRSLASLMTQNNHLAVRQGLYRECLGRYGKTPKDTAASLDLDLIFHGRHVDQSQGQLSRSLKDGRRVVLPIGHQRSLEGS